MKRILIILCLLATGFVSPAWAQQRTNTLTLAWDPNPPEENVLVYKLWVMTNIPPGVDLLSLQGSGTVINSAPPPESSKPLWTLIAEIPATEHEVTLDNEWSAYYRMAFFTLTASNFIGESEMSNMAWIPSMVSSNRLYIERTD